MTRLPLLAVVLGLVTTQLALVPAASAAPGDAVMRTTRASALADEVLNVDVLGNVDPPAGTTWDRSSVCLPYGGACVKTIAIDGFTKTVEDDGTITTYTPSRFGGASGVTYAVRDSAGGTHAAFLDITEKLTPGPRVGAPDPAVHARLRVTQAVSPTTFDRPDQALTWTSVVTNTGDVDLGRLFVTDASFHVSARTCSPVAQGGTLAAGASTTCTGTLTTRQDYLDEHADRSDTLTAIGRTTVGGIAYKASATATATSVPVQRARLSLEGSVDPASGPGDGPTAAYAFVATNRGNVTLRELVVRAPFPGLAGLVCSPVAMGQDLAPGASTTCRADRLTTDLRPGRRTDVARATAKTLTSAVNATATVSLEVPAPATTGPAEAASPTAPGGPQAAPDRAETTVGHPVTVDVLANDTPAPEGERLLGPSVRLRLAPGLPSGSVLYGDVKSLVVPQTQPDPFRPFQGGLVLLVSGRGEITVVPIGYEPAPELTVGYQVTDAAGRTARSTLLITVNR